MLMIAQMIKGNYLNCITLGIDHYLIKPFDVSELLSIIKNSFPFLEDKTSTFEIGNVRTDIKILIIEDNKMNQNVIGMMLKSLGYSFELSDDDMQLSGSESPKNLILFLWTLSCLKWMVSNLPND